MASDIGLVARARALIGHLVPRATLERFSEAGDLTAFSRSVGRLGSDVSPVGEPWELSAFERAVREIAHISRHLLDDLVTTAPPRDRETEAARARVRAAKRFGTSVA